MFPFLRPLVCIFTKESLLRRESPFESEVWFGLHENEFAYAWSDMTPVNFISISADLSKENRHLSEDCFILKRDSNIGKW